MTPARAGKSAQPSASALSAPASRRGLLTPATVFINQNYLTARALLPRLLVRQAAAGRKIHLIASEHADLGRFRACTGIVPASVLRVPAMDAFPSGLTVLDDAARGFGADDVVLICAGPLGRLLAVKWHRAQPLATYLELGSFFDPDLQQGGVTLVKGSVRCV